MGWLSCERVKLFTVCFSREIGRSGGSRQSCVIFSEEHQFNLVLIF